MNQDESRSTATLPPEDLTPVDPETLVTTYADSLITELFDDVDKILEGDDAALAAVEFPPEPASTAIAPIVDVSAARSEPSGSDQTLATLGHEIDFFSGDDGQPVAPPAQTKQRFGRWLDRLLLAVTALSLLGVGGLLWFGQQGNRFLLGRSPGPETTAQSDEEFLTYLQRSLDVISGKVERGELGNGTNLGQAPTGVVVPAPPMLPPLGAGGTVGSLGSGPLNVIERVYIPYQTAQQSVASPGAPALVPALPGTVAPAAPTPAASAPAAAAPAPIHTMVGILELGDRSAALFEINGVSQRVYIGERIGNSGWSLVSVSNQEAVIRRNGEVRSIFIGQRF